MSNTAAVGASGLAGIATLGLIGAHYGAAALGAFNLLLAIFLIAGQISVLGIQASVIRSVALSSVDKLARSEQTAAGLVASLLTASPVAAILWAVRIPIEGVVARPGIGNDLAWVAAAVLLFALNKVVLASLNGRSDFLAFALLTAARPLLMLGALVALIAQSAGVENLVLLFAASEGALLLIGVVTISGELLGARLSREFWINVMQHLKFGLRGFGGNLLQELNVRIDIVVLSLFVSDQQLGIYSLAAIAVESLAQIPIVIRHVVAPSVIRDLRSHDWGKMANRVRYLRPRVRLAVTALALPVVLLYPWGVRFVTSDVALAEGRMLFVILLGGMIFAAGYAPFSLVLVQGGHPGAQTVLAGFAVMVNTVGNFALIPALGPTGAAVATSLSLIAATGALRWSARSLLGFTLPR